MSGPVINTLNVRDIVARIDRNLAETAKLFVEAEKFRRDRFLAPILAAGALGGAVATLLPIILRGWGVH